MTDTLLPTNFIYPEIKESDRSFGATVDGPILRADGDWRSFLPPEEDQNVRGIESSACYTEATQHSIATLQEEAFNLPDQNYSARFNALLSNGTPTGGDPVAAAKSIKFDGMILESMMTFASDIQSWQDFHSWKGVNMRECIDNGKEWVDQWDFNFKILVEKDYPLEIKYLQLQEGLKRAPCPISVVGWFKRDGEYYKPQGMRDNHLVEALHVDGQNRITIRDTYFPYTKVLAPNFDFEFSLMPTLAKKNLEQELNIIERLLALIGQWIGIKQQILALPSNPPPSPVLPQEQPIKPKLLILCQAICDFEGKPGDRNYRNNNPGNCKYFSGGYLPVYEEVKKDKDGFAIFKHWEIGFLYLKNLVKSKAQKHPSWSILDFVEDYAPRSENDTMAYANFLVHRLKISTDFKLGELLV